MCFLHRSSNVHRGTTGTSPLVRRARLRVAGLGLVLGFAVVRVGSDVTAGERASPSSQKSGTAEVEKESMIHVKDGRPLAVAAEQMGRRFGVAVTYEDPAYVNAADLEDVTEKVRRDLAMYPKGQAPKVLVPREAEVNGVAKEPAAGGQLSNPRELLESLVESNEKNRNPGKFKVTRTDDVFHIVPVEVLSADGKWVPFQSLLSTRISLGNVARPRLDTLQAIADALEKATGSKVTLGMAPLNRLGEDKFLFVADNEPASDVLTRVLRTLDGRFVWSVTYDPGLKWWFINITEVPAAGLPAPTSQPAKPAS